GQVAFVDMALENAGAVVDHEVRAGHRGGIGRAGLVGVRVGGGVGDHGLDARVLTGDVLGDAGVDGGRGDDVGAVAPVTARVGAAARGEGGDAEQAGGGECARAQGAGEGHGARSL